MGQLGAPRGSRPITPASPSERPLRTLAAGVLVFLVYPGSRLAGGGLGAEAIAAVSVAVVVVLYLWAVWHRHGQHVWLAVAAMVAIGVVVPPVGGATWIGLLLFPAIASAIVLRRWVGVSAAVALAAVMAGEGVALRADRAMVVSLALVMVLGAAGAAGYLRLVQTNALLASARAEVARLAAAQERSRLGRDLHDAVQQELFVASMEIGTVQVSVGCDPGGARAHLAAAADAVAHAKAELAEVIRCSRAAPSRRVDLEEELRRYLAQWSGRHPIPTVVEGSVAGCLPGPVSAALVWAVREAVANVLRHAHARRVGVNLAGDQEHVEVRVADDGCGFDTDRSGSGHGLAIMAERLDAVGGHVDIRSCPGEGTEVVLSWAAEERAWVVS